MREIHYKKCYKKKRKFLYNHCFSKVCMALSKILTIIRCLTIMYKVLKIYLYYVTVEKRFNFITALIIL